ncbi:hypothetical protein [Listeria innocua]|uniref:hypothetical protein n=1 Tax=Listeria innocua TaxID=1642 RepID=UPI00162744BF|nr:hypothetical protein [Listeria innocua]MBC1925433.1 hypothetical protein [Listeria innocua]
MKSATFKTNNSTVRLLAPNESLLTDAGSTLDLEANEQYSGCVLDDRYRVLFNEDKQDLVFFDQPSESNRFDRAHHIVFRNVKYITAFSISLTIFIRPTLYFGFLLSKETKILSSSVDFVREGTLIIFEKEIEFDEITLEMTLEKDCCYGYKFHLPFFFHKDLMVSVNIKKENNIYCNLTRSCKYNPEQLVFIPMDKMLSQDDVPILFQKRDQILTYLFETWDIKIDNEIKFGLLDSQEYGAKSFSGLILVSPLLMENQKTLDVTYLCHEIAHQLLGNKIQFGDLESQCFFEFLVEALQLYYVKEFYGPEIQTWLLNRLNRLDHRFLLQFENFSEIRLKNTIVDLQRQDIIRKSNIRNMCTEEELSIGFAYNYLS